MLALVSGQREHLDFQPLLGRIEESWIEVFVLSVHFTVAVVQTRRVSANLFAFSRRRSYSGYDRAPRSADKCQRVGLGVPE